MILPHNFIAFCYCIFLLHIFIAYFYCIFLLLKFIAYFYCILLSRYYILILILQWIICIDRSKYCWSVVLHLRDVYVLVLVLFCMLILMEQVNIYFKGICLGLLCKCRKQCKHRSRKIYWDWGKYFDLNILAI